MNLSLMSTAVSEITIRGITCMFDCLADAGAGAPGVLGRYVFAFVLVALLVFARSAHAATTHTFVSNFGSAGSGDGQLSHAASSGSAVNSATATVDTAGSPGIGSRSIWSSAWAPVPPSLAARLPRVAAGLLVGTVTVTVSLLALSAGSAAASAGNGDAFSSAGSGSWGGALFSSLATTGHSYVGDHSYTNSFGGAGAGDSQFASNAGVAVDRATGDVYVADAANSRVEKFDSSGSFVAAWGWGVDDGTAALQVCASGCQAGISGAGAGQLATPKFVAVDNSGGPSAGDVYVGDTANNTVTKFDSAGNLVATNDGSGSGNVFGSLAGVAVNGGGDLWVYDGNADMRKFAQDGSFITQWNSFYGVTAAGIAVDDDDNVYVVRGVPAVEKFSGEGSDLGELDGTGSATALAIDDGQLYVVEGASVNRFDTNCALPDCIPSETFGGANIAGATGIASDGIRLYVSDAANSEIDAFDATAVAYVATDPADPVTLGAATLHGTVSLGSEAATDCHFDYGIDDSYGQTAPCETVDGGQLSGPGDIPVDTNDHQVTSDLVDLTSNAVYHYRLVVSNADADSEGADQSFTVPGPPTISTTTATDIAATEAILRAQVHPHGEAATYHFEYGTTTAYGTTIPTPDASAGSGTQDLAIFQPLSGLQPATTYHYRVVASSVNGTTTGLDKTFTTYRSADPTPQSCANAQFRIGPGTTLPDCRAYEQATPTNKNGNNPISGIQDFVEASESGDAITFLVPGGIPGGVGAQNYPSYLAQRGNGAWSSAGIFPPAAYGQGGAVEGWTRDLKTVFSTALFFGSSGASRIFLARSSADGSHETIVPYTPNSDVGSYAYAGASRDGSKVYFEAIGALTPEAVPGKDNLYVWDRADGVVSLAGVLPDDSTPAGGSFAGPYIPIDNGGFSDSGGAQLSAYLQDNHAISDDGTRVFFTSSGAAQFYVRKNAIGPGASTVHLSASQKTNGPGLDGSDPNGPQPAKFMVATPDASKALFTSPEELTNDANTGTADQGADLYAYDLASDELTDLSPDSGDANGADVKGVIGISDDASYVYFVANGVLADGATPGTCSGVLVSELAGVCNLYVWHDGDTSFIAQLDQSTGHGPRDSSNWQDTVNTGAVPGQPTGRVTADGKTMLFRSKRQLTDYDNSSGCGLAGADACPELYLYRVDDPDLTCVSCNPTGTAPTSRAELQAMAQVNDENPASTRTRNLSSNGDRVFFESSDPLLSDDTNGVQDVYLWQADESGSCHSALDNGGCLYLLSTGRSPDNSYFADASISGDDAFLFTSSRLVGKDRDDLVDIYDAHVGGGLAGQYPLAQAPCLGEGCKASPTSPTAPPIAASVAFSGDGNAVAPARTVVSVSRLRAVIGSVARLRVKVPRAGRISVSGASLRTTRKSVSRGATYSVTVRLSAKARKRLLRSRSTLKVEVHIVFRPRTGASVSKTMTLAFKRSIRARHTAGHHTVAKGGDR